MAQYGILIYHRDSAHDPGAHDPENPDPEAVAAIEECDDHADEVLAAGAMRSAWALTPRAMATSISAAGRRDAPYLGAAEIVAGFYVIEAADLAEAERIAATNPVIRNGGGVEIRPIHSGGVVGEG